MENIFALITWMIGTVLISTCFSGFDCLRHGFLAAFGPFFAFRTNLVISVLLDALVQLLHNNFCVADQFRFGVDIGPDIIVARSNLDRFGPSTGISVKESDFKPDGNYQIEFVPEGRKTPVMQFMLFTDRRPADAPCIKWDLGQIDEFLKLGSGLIP